jgi:hypothetical protein
MAWRRLSLLSLCVIRSRRHPDVLVSHELSPSSERLATDTSESLPEVGEHEQQVVFTPRAFRIGH